MEKCPLGHEKDEAQPCSICAKAWQELVKSLKFFHDMPEKVM